MRARVWDLAGLRAVRVRRRDRQRPHEGRDDPAQLLQETRYAGLCTGRRCPSYARGRPLAAAAPVTRGDGPWPPPHARGAGSGAPRARPQVPKTPREGIRGKRGRATRRLAGRAAGRASWPATAFACRIRRRGTDGSPRNPAVPRAGKGRRPRTGPCPEKEAWPQEAKGGALGEEAEGRSHASGRGTGGSCGGGMPGPARRTKAPHCVPDAGGHLGGQNNAAIPVP